MRWLVLLVFSCWSTIAYADIAPSPLFGGGNLQLMKEASVRMRREHVTIKLYPKAQVVDATFVLVNEGATKSLQIGFPGEGVRTGRYESHMPLQNFSVTVDGKAVPATASQVRHSFKTPMGDRGYTETWHVFDASLTKGKEVIVAVRYGVDTHPEYDDPEHARASYILATGRPWKGGIDEAVIEVIAMDGVDPAVIELKPRMPKQASRTKTGLSLTYKKLEPTSDDDLSIWYRIDPQASATVDWNALAPKL